MKKELDKLILAVAIMFAITIIFMLGMISAPCK